MSFLLATVTPPKLCHIDIYITRFARFVFQSVSAVPRHAIMSTRADDGHDVVRVTYTVLPLVAVLLLVARPFVNRSEALKIASISAAAVAFATPWDDWSAARDDGDAAADVPPLERYASAAVLSAATALWAVLCVRWSTPCSSFNHDRASYRLVRWAPIAAALCAAAAAGGTARPAARALAAAALWYGAGNFVVRRAGSSAAAVAAPVAYAYWALRGGPSSPERAASLLVADAAVVVLAVSACDKAHGVMDTYALEFPRRPADGLRAFARQTLRAFVTPEHALSAAVTRDIGRCVGVLNVASKSFTSASFLFQAGERAATAVYYIANCLVNLYI